MATFGHTTAEASWNVDFINGKAGTIFSLTEAGQLTDMRAYVRNTDAGHAACHAKLLVYAVSAGVPAALLATSTEASIADNAVAAWTTPSISISLSSGTYVLALIGDASAAGLALAYVATGTSYWPGADQGYVDNYADGPANPWGSNVSQAGTFSIYATYTPLRFMTLNHGIW